MACLFTNAYLLARIRVLLNDVAETEWSDDELNKWIQEAATDISTKTLGYESIDRINLAANTLEYDEPSDCSKVHACIIVPLIDPGTEYIIRSTLKDGYIWSGYKNTWAEARGLATGQSVSDSAANRGDAMHATYTGAKYTISRSFFYFDLSGLAAGTVVSAQLDIDGNGENDSSVGIQEGTQAATLTTADFDSFTGASFGNTASWLNTAINEFTINSIGLAYLQTVLNASGTALICAREYTKDIGSVTPTGYNANGCRFADEAIAEDEPRLRIWIS